MKAFAQSLGFAALWACAVLQATAAAGADQPPSEKGPAAKSLPLRTALHHDPTLAAPLERLLAIYRGAGAVDELIGLYRAHVTQYPRNVSGRTVLVRLLAATGDPQALRSAQAAVAQFPKNAYLQYVLYELLRDRRHPKALDHLDKAIALETDPRRKMAWIDALLPAATVAGRRDLAEKHLLALAALVDRPDECLLVARKMLKFEFYGPALELLQKKTATPPAPETMVTIELEAATAEVGLDRMEAAGARLDRLLAKLTADYWRRGEIVRRRLALVKTEAERKAMIGRARKRVEANPRDVAAVLDLAQVLSGLQFRRDALEVLLEAGRRLPKSTGIERRILELFDLLRDERGREKYLAQRIKAHPGRRDLAVLHVKTLYLLSRRSEALAELTGLLDAVKGDEKVPHLLEMARFLRRSTLLADAAELFRRVIELDPARLDVRRELAETYLALGERQRLRELFSGTMEKRASLENLLDLVQFMIQQELFIEARSALVERVKGDKENLDLRMRLLDVERRLGNSHSGEKLIGECRKLADTGARYRLWLESAAVFHEDFDSLEAFLEAEQTRLEEDPSEWTPRRLERRLAFAEIAARSGRQAQVVAMLEADLESDLPANYRIRIRRRLIGILDQDATQVAVVQRQLEDLAKQQQYADECNARLALLHARTERHDLAVALLAKIDLSRIHDAEIINSLKPLYLQRGGSQKQILAVLERLTVLEPTDRRHWEQWVTALAAARDESRLRGALRRLLAGVEKMPLSDETRTLLRRHVADSYWRDVGRRLADGREASLADTLALLDSAAQTAHNDRHWLWTAWIRAYVLGRLGRAEARDEAVAELERMVADLPAAKNQTDAAPPRIAFPDGITISLDHARKLLTEVPPIRTAGKTEPRRGPLPELSVKWSFQAGPQTPIAAILPLDDSRTLICDRYGNGHCLDAATGKLVWSRDLLPTASPRPQQTNRSSFPSAPWKPLTDGKGRLYVPTPSQVSCYAVEDGRLLWRADVGAVRKSQQGKPAPAGLPNASIFLHGENVLTYEPLSGTLTRIDPETGKVVWERAFAPEHSIPAMHLSWLNAGASLSGNRLFVYSAKTAILDAGTGEVQWWFEPFRVRKFPVELDIPVAQDAPAPSGAVSAYRGHTPTPSPRPHMHVAAAPRVASRYAMPTSASYPPSSAFSPQPPPTQYVNYLQSAPVALAPQGRISLTGPAVFWASKVGQGMPRCAKLMDHRLLLFDRSGLQIIHTDFPLAGKQVQVSGQFVGMAGRVACLLVGAQLSLVDVTTGTVKQSSLQEITGPPVVPFQAVVDGPLVYVSGPGGILCVKAVTAERVFHAPWPEEVAPPKPPKPKPAKTAASTSPPYSTTSYIPGSARIYRTGAPAFAFPVPPSSHPGHAVTRTPYNVPGAFVPPISCIDRGVLYTLVTPTRVVALAERKTDGP